MEERREETIVTTTTTPGVTPVAPVPPTTVVTTPGVVAAPVSTASQSVEEVTVDPYAARRWALYRTWQVIALLLGIVDGLIAIRFVLRLLGANAGAGFAQFIYGLTGPLMAPFIGLFGSPRFEGSVFETTALVAMIVYALLAWVIYKTIALLFSETRTGVTSTRRTDTRIR